MRTPSHPSRPLGWLLALGLVLGALALAGCRSDSVVDRRILQVLNREGFGRRYAGRAQQENYVTIGDTITFVDAINADVRGTEIVDIDGTIQLPEAGAVFVAGMTRQELQTYLDQKLAPFFDRVDLEVSLKSGGAKVYYVVGEVETPGARPFRGDTTVFEAVIEAQPFQFTANLGRVRVIRADPRNPLVIPVNVADMWDNGDSTFNVQLQEFDIVYVPPTLLKQLGDFISGLVVPILTPFRAVIQTVFYYDRGFYSSSRYDGRVF